MACVLLIRSVFAANPFSLILSYQVNKHAPYPVAAWTDAYPGIFCVRGLRTGWLTFVLLRNFRWERWHPCRLPVMRCWTVF